MLTIKQRNDVAEYAAYLHCRKNSLSRESYDKVMHRMYPRGLCIRWKRSGRVVEGHIRHLITLPPYLRVMNSNTGKVYMIEPRHIVAVVAEPKKS